MSAEPRLYHEWSTLKILVTQMCVAMHCGTNQDVETLRRTIYQRYGDQGWLAHGALLADLAEHFAPDAARDLTGSVLPHHVLAVDDEAHMRACMADTGLPPQEVERMMDHNRRAITHCTHILGHAHLQEASAALNELRTALEHDVETLMATVSLLLRIASDVFPCPHHTPQPTP